MKVGNTYHHTKCLDVDMMVLRINAVCATGLALEVAFVNKRLKNFFFMDSVFVKNEDVKKWSDVSHLY
jgi:hypothetical protein